jgi:SMI1 / KNR4 family (SUKH-1)
MCMEQCFLTGFGWAETGAAESAIEDVQAELGRTLPADYLAVMRAHNGGEGWVGDGAYLRLWPVEELVETNRTLEASSLVPGVILIGSDGADGLYGVVVDQDSEMFMEFPAVGLSSDQGRKLGESWGAFLKTLSES